MKFHQQKCKRMNNSSKEIFESFYQDYRLTEIIILSRKTSYRERDLDFRLVLGSSKK